MKYHLSSIGPRECEAEIRACPLKGKHYNSLQEALQAAVDKELEALTPPASNQELSLAPSQLASYLAGIEGTRFDIGDGGAEGHAVGNIAENTVFQQLTREFPGGVFKTGTFLTQMLTANPGAITAIDRVNLLGSEDRQLIFGRTPGMLKRWKPGDTLPSHQQDTADIILVQNPQGEITGRYLHALDVKSTQKNSGPARPANTISAAKVFAIGKSILSHPEGNISYDFFYVHIPWESNGDGKDRHGTFLAPRVIELFRIPPGDLAINWTAGMQIQMDLSVTSQGFDGSRKEWARQYCLHYLASKESNLRKRQLLLEEEMKDFQSFIARPSSNTD